MAGVATTSLLTPTIIAKEALMMLKNSMVMGSLVHRKYKEEFVKVGGSITIRKPVKFTVTKSRVRTTALALTEKSITLTVSTQAHVSWSFHTVDLTLTIDEYSERYIKPACNVLANTVDKDLCDLYKNIYNAVSESTGFVDPETFMVLGNAATKLDEEAAPQDDRCVVLNPGGHWSLANALRTLYVTDVAKPIVTKGYLAKIANFQVYMDQNITAHTTGQWATESASTDGTGAEVAGTVEIASSAVLTSACLLCDFDSPNDILTVGDIFTIAGVFAVNPISGQSTGKLRQFVVTTLAATSSTGTTTEAVISVAIQPGIADSGPYKTVSTVPAAGAAVDILGHVAQTYPQNLAFHKNAFALVMVPLDMPHGAWGARATEESTGISIRVLKAYDINTDEEVCRLDILYGVKTLYPELACRIFGLES